MIATAGRILPHPNVSLEKEVNGKKFEHNNSEVLLLCRTPSTSFLPEIILQKSRSSSFNPIADSFILLFFYDSSHCANVQF
jgi:hypothetical protein